MALPRRDPPSGSGGNNTESWRDPEFVMSFPALHSFLYDQKYDDGTTRLTGSISIFTKLGALTAAVNDNDRQLVAFINAATWDELLSLLESAVLNDNADWKARKQTQPANRPPF